MVLYHFFHYGRMTKQVKKNLKSLQLFIEIKKNQLKRLCSHKILGPDGGDGGNGMLCIY